MWSASSRTVISTADRSAWRGFHVILEPARAGDDDVDALAQLGDLRLRAHPAEDGDRAQVRRGGQRCQRRIDLCDEFTGRGEDECARTARCPLGVARCEPGDHRQQEGVGLPGPGATTAEHVAAGQ